LLLANIKKMMIAEDFNFENLVQDALRKALKERGHVNIIIAGRTGVGKSTLINAIFQGNLATTGQGRPVTQDTREFKKEAVPLSIFDTRGLEMADYKKLISDLDLFANGRAKNIDPSQHIHVAWICIAEDSRRVEPAEENFVKMLAEYMPVIAVITKARADNEFRSEVQKLLPLVKNVVRVRAIKEKDDDGIVKYPKGLCELVELTMQVLPEGLQRAFTAAQKVDIGLKKSKSRLIMTTAASTAATAAAVPIPFSDAIAIVPIQVGMIAGISATFGLPIDNSFLLTILGSIVTGAGGTLAGRAIVSNLLKLIPGVGSAPGMAIAATTAFSLTSAFGEAYIAALEMSFTQNNGETPSLEDVTDAFKKNYLQLAAGK
jgi:uncharacterized protein (DUF697 family)/GTP-binding protein EngB required for normal cell division